MSRYYRLKIQCATFFPPSTWEARYFTSLRKFAEIRLPLQTLCEKLREVEGGDAEFKVVEGLYQGYWCYSNVCFFEPTSALKELAKAAE